MSRFLGLLILLVVFLCTLQVEAARPGDCPKPVNSNNNVSCANDTCHYDQECPGHLKCCYTGCSYQCLTPRCPFGFRWRFAGNVLACVSICRRDSALRYYKGHFMCIPLCKFGTVYRHYNGRWMCLSRCPLGFSWKTYGNSTTCVSICKAGYVYRPYRRHMVCRRRCPVGYRWDRVGTRYRCVLNVCELPKKVGPCTSPSSRWYHNGAKCVTFIYGGCQGNGNNFQTKAECEKKCP